jgi:hypothetical protein
MPEVYDPLDTSKNEICPLFALVKLAPPLHKHHLYPIKSETQTVNSCLFTGCIKKVIEL